LEYLRPASWADAVALKTELPGARPINGGTDVMVEVNFGRERPDALLDLSHLSELRKWDRADGSISIGAGVTYTQVIDQLSEHLPALAIASRTVGSPQIRNRGTIAGNLATGSPAGDAHPPLLASGADVVAESMRGRRTIPIGEFFTGVKKTALEPDELIRSIVVPTARGPQQFSKVGTRNAMVIAVVAFAIAIDVTSRTIGTGIGSAAPTPIRADTATRFLEGELADGGYWDDGRDLQGALQAEFAARVAAAASPIDDVRGTADYRRHALHVLAERTLGWAWQAYDAGNADAA